MLCVLKFLFSLPFAFQEARHAVSFSKMRSLHLVGLHKGRNAFSKRSFSSLSRNCKNGQHFALSETPRGSENANLKTDSISRFVKPQKVKRMKLLKTDSISPFVKPQQVKRMQI